MAIHKAAIEAVQNLQGQYRAITHALERIERGKAAYAHRDDVATALEAIFPSNQVQAELQRIRGTQAVDPETGEPAIDENGRPVYAGGIIGVLRNRLEEAGVEAESVDF